jgi:hypothetical protein
MVTGTSVDVAVAGTNPLAGLKVVAVNAEA